MVEFAKCARSLDVLFVLDQSGSVSVDNWEKEKEFAAQLSEGLAKLYTNPQFGIIVFGPASVPRPLSNVTAQQISRQIRSLRGCQEYYNPADLTARTCTTPTDQAIALARKEFANSGRNDTSRLLFLVTDGRPETGLYLNDQPVSQSLVNQTLQEATIAKQQGISIVTVGIALDVTTQQVMNEIASNPPEDYSYPNVTSFDELITRLPTILASSCFYIQGLSPAIGCAGDNIAVIGENLFATDDFLRCRFTFPNGDQVTVKGSIFILVFFSIHTPHIDINGHTLWKKYSLLFFPSISDVKRVGHHFNNTLMHCLVPDRGDSSETASLEVTTDGQGFTDNGFSFQYLSNCSQHRDDNNITAALGVMPVTERGIADWWPWLFFLLLPLLCCLLLCLWCCCRRKPKEQKRVVVSTTETTPEEEAFQIEGLETNSVPPSSTKWKVQPAAYIGFGKGKMDVNWNGEAPESAPHALKRQQVQVDTLEDPVEGIPLTPAGGAHVARPRKRRGCCPWLCCVASQDPQYPSPSHEGEGQRFAQTVPRVVFHADSAHSNTTLESKNDVEG